MKVLFIGDPHIRVENFSSIDKLNIMIERVVRENGVDIILVAGDVMHYHERLHTLALNKSIEFLVDMGKLCKVVCLVGNHDMINNQQFLTSNHWMRHYKDRLPNVDVIDTAQSYEVDGVRFVCCPYVYPGRFIEALETATPKTGDEFHWSESDIIFAHQEFKGCKMGAIISDTGDDWDESYPQVVSGHIHDYQKPQTNVFYPGTPMQHSFGDKGDNIILLIEVGDGVRFTEIPTEVEKKKTVYTSIDDVSKVLEKGVKSTEDEKIKVAIKGTAEEFKVFKDSKEYKELVKAGVSIAFKQEAKVRPDVNSKDIQESDFHEILISLLTKTENKRVLDDYKQVFHDMIVL